MSDGEGRGGHSEQNGGRGNGHGECRFAALLTVLSDPYCHSVLYYLATRADGPVTVEELARQFVGSETGYHPSTLIEAEYAEIQQALQQTHLPRLADVNLITFDARQGVIQAQRPSWACLLLGGAGYLIDRLR